MKKFIYSYELMILNDRMMVIHEHLNVMSFEAIKLVACTLYVFNYELMIMVVVVVENVCS